MTRRPLAAVVVALGLLTLVAAVSLVSSQGTNPALPAVVAPTPPAASPGDVPAPRVTASSVPAGPAQPVPGHVPAALEEDTAAPSVLPEVQLRLGAEAFAQRDWETARRRFRSIVDESPNHPMAPYAAYKMAWCEANLGDHRAAITEIQRVIGWLRDEGRPEEAVTMGEALMDLEHFRSQLDTGG